MKRILIYLAITISASALVLVFFGERLLVPVIAANLGVKYESYESRGLARFVLNDLSFEHEGNVLKIESLNCPSIVSYGMRFDRKFYFANWKFIVSGEGDESQNPASVWNELIASFEEVSEHVNVVHAKDGHLSFNSNGVSVANLEVDFRNKSLVVSGVADSIGGAFNLLVDDWSDSRAEFSLVIPEYDFDMAGVAALSSDSIGFDGDASIYNGTVALSALWNESGLESCTADFVASDLDIARMLPSSGVGGLINARGEWNKGNWTASWAADLEMEGLKDVVKITGSGSGDMNHVTIEECEASIPFVSAALSDPLVLDFARGNALDKMQISIDADMPLQDVYPVEGILKGAATLKLKEWKLYPDSFSLESHALKIDAYEIKDLKAVAYLDWPTIRIESCAAVIKDQFTVTGNGVYDYDKGVFESRAVIADYRSDESVEIELSGDDTYKLQLRSSRLSRRFLSDLPGLSGMQFPDYELNDVELNMSIEESRIAGIFRAEVRAENPDIDKWGGTILLSFSPSGTKIDRGLVVYGGEEVLDASGFLPYALRISSAEGVEFVPSGESEAKIRIISKEKPGTVMLAEYLGYHASELTVDGEIQGRSGNISGIFNIAAESFSSAADENINFNNLELRIYADEDHLTFENLSFRYLAHPFQGDAKFKMGREEWRKLIIESKLPDLGLSIGRVSAVGFPVSALEPWLKDRGLSKEGALSAQIAWGGGEKINGSIELKDLSSIYFENLGKFRRISGSMTFENSLASLEHFSASLNGKPIGLSGNVNLKDYKNPSFDIKAKGEGVVFYHEDGVIVRGSPDIVLSSDGAQTIIKGKIDMDDLVIVSNIGSITHLASGALSWKSSKPAEDFFPHFWYDKAPFADWKFDVVVTGNNTVKTKSPLYYGIGSMKFKLGGDLKRPIALGEFKVSSGAIQFPFSKFRITSGRAYTNPGSEGILMLDIKGKARYMGYDLGIHISGKADTPKITFTSAPSLSTREIMQLVTTGHSPDPSRRNTSALKYVGLGRRYGSILFPKSNLFSSEGKDWELYVGEEVNESGRGTVKVVYPVSRKLSVAGENNRYGEYNADVYYKIYEK